MKRSPSIHWKRRAIYRSASCQRRIRANSRLCSEVKIKRATDGGHHLASATASETDLHTNVANCENIPKHACHNIVQNLSENCTSMWALGRIITHYISCEKEQEGGVNQVEEDPDKLAPNNGGLGGIQRYFLMLQGVPTKKTLLPKKLHASSPYYETYVCIHRSRQCRVRICILRDSVRRGVGNC